MEAVRSPLGLLADWSPLLQILGLDLYGSHNCVCVCFVAIIVLDKVEFRAYTTLQSFGIDGSAGLLVDFGNFPAPRLTNFKGKPGLKLLGRMRASFDFRCNETISRKSATQISTVEVSGQVTMNLSDERQIVTS
jgi:hypothetical protein